MTLLSSAALLVVGGCTLIDLSGLQSETSSSAVTSTGVTTTTSTTSTSSDGGSSPCGSTVCFHGDCQVDSGMPVCVCDEHFDGPQCNDCAVGYVGTDCLACAAGYQDADDDGSCRPACTPDLCSDHGVCDESSGAASCHCHAGFSGTDCSNACASGTSGPDCVFQIVYGLDIPGSGNWLAPADVPYDVDESGTVPAFSRVAYLLVLDDQEVWVEMDAFTDQANMLGLPVDWIWDIGLTNVLVSAFSGNQASIDVPSNGAMEFWSECYDEGPNGIYDADDDIRVGPDCYGSMQVSVNGLIVFALNAWANGGTTFDLGIGPSSGTSTDWTFAGNAFAYSVRRLEVYVRP